MFVIILQSGTAVRYLSRGICTIIFVAAGLFSSPLWAQAEGAAGGNDTGANVGYEIGANIGNLLPNQVPGLTEVTGMGGVRGGYQTGNLVFLEGGATRGRGHGSEITNLEASVRMDIPVENIVGLVYLGPNLTHYKSEGRKELFYGGGHVGGGIQALVGGNVWFRSDMTFTVNPGTTLYIGFGFTFRFPNGGGAGGG